MKKIIITGIDSTRNKGCWAMLHSVVSSIRKNSPVPVEFIFLKRHNVNEEVRLKDLEIKTQVRPWTLVSIPKLRTLWLLWCAAMYPVFALFLSVTRRKKTNSNFMRQMLTADLVLDLGGDSYSTDYATISIISLCIPLLVARILGKPYYFCAQSIGPLGNTIPYKILKFILKDADLITTRERISDDFLKSCNIFKNVIKTQDLAFILPVASPARIDEICKEERIDKNLKWAGISISDLISKYFTGSSSVEEKEQKYVSAMARMCDHLVEKHHYHLIFIPHVEIDRGTSEKVKTHMKRQNNVSILRGDYSPEELKGIIFLCDIVIGSRMHATLAALSQAVPSLTFAYNHKALGINGAELGQSGYLIDIREVDIADLWEITKDRTDRLIEQKEGIKLKLIGILPEIKRTAEKNALYALDLLETAGPLKYMSEPLNCTGCGTCVAACPTDSIVMKKTVQGTWRPRFNGACNSCGRCLEVCPALGFDISKEEISFFGQPATDPQIGVVQTVYAGYAENREIRFKGSSGGLVSALSAYLLESKSIDAVLVTTADQANPLMFKGCWASTPEDVYQGRGSKYTPIALNQALKEIPAGAKTICFVGLPCHLWGLRCYEKAGFFKNINIKYRFSLFCGRTPSAHATDFIVEKSKTKTDSIEKIQYRGDGWPAGFKITPKVQDFVDSYQNPGPYFPLGEIWPRILSTPFFLPVHCYRCPDFFGYLSDISFGDGWLPDLAGDPNGWSACLARTDNGVALLKEATERGVIILEQRLESEIKQAFKGNLVAKIDRRALKNRRFKTTYPVCRGDKASAEYRNSKKANFGEGCYYRLMRLFAYQSFRDSFLSYPPNRFMRVSNKVMNKLLQ